MLPPLIKPKNKSTTTKPIKYATPSKLKEKRWNYFQISMSPSQALLHVRSGIHLYTYEQIPSHQQDNPFITGGYRSYLSARQCLNSVLILSNELVNIWTHGGMGFIFLILLFYDQTFLLPTMQSSISDHFIFLTFSLCILACMMCSAGYHTFNCHVHAKVSTRWHAADLYGITIGMLGCYCIGLYYGFYCAKGVRTFYVVLIAIMIIGSGIVMMHPDYLSKRWHYYRLAHLTSLTVFGLLPTVHWSIITPANEVKMFLPDVIIFYAILAVAVSFYVSKVPERIWPGHFNFAGQSHNLWHILINISMLYWRNFAFRVLHYRLTTSCQNIAP